MKEKMKKNFNAYGTMPENQGYQQIRSDSEDEIDIEHENCK